MVTLVKLLCHAGVHMGIERTWFHGVEWKPPYLYVDEPADVVAMINRLWAPAMRELVPDLQVRQTLREAPVAKPVKPVYTGKVFKKSYYQARLAEGDE